MRLKSRADPQVPMPCRLWRAFVLLLPTIMSLNNVTPGSKTPEVFNVVIEISANSAPVKYEVDKESGCLFVDRFLGTAMHYP